MFQYYHEESGVYIGPAHAFDDADLEYLNNEENDEHNEAEALVKVKPSPPISSLSLDSLSGIYLGFAEKVKRDEDQDETRDLNDINVTIVADETEEVHEEDTTKKNIFLKAKRLKEKMSNPSSSEFSCFKLFRR